MLELLHRFLSLWTSVHSSTYLLLISHATAYPCSSICLSIQLPIINSSVHSSIHPSLLHFLSIHYSLPPIYLFIPSSIHPSFCLPAFPPFIYLSMYPSSSSHICTFMCPLLPTRPSSPTHLFIHFSLVTHPSLFIHPYSFTHLFSLFIVSNCPSVHTAFRKIHSQYIHVKKCMLYRMIRCGKITLVYLISSTRDMNNGT